MRIITFIIHINFNVTFACCFDCNIAYKSGMVLDINRNDNKYGLLHINLYYSLGFIHFWFWAYSKECGYECELVLLGLCFCLFVCLCMCQSTTFLPEFLLQSKTDTSAFFFFCRILDLVGTLWGYIFNFARSFFNFVENINIHVMTVSGIFDFVFCCWNYVKTTIYTWNCHRITELVCCTDL